jgi:hypothetical protein
VIENAKLIDKIIVRVEVEYTAVSGGESKSKSRSPGMWGVMKQVPGMRQKYTDRTVLRLHRDSTGTVRYSTISTCT